jgi:hypothetical protein
MGYQLDGQCSIPGKGQEIYVYSTASRPTPRPTQPPIQGVHGAFSLRVKRPGCEADHSRTRITSAEVKNGGAIPPLPHMFSLIKHMDNVTCSTYES